MFLFVILFFKQWIRGREKSFVKRGTFTSIPCPSLFKALGFSASVSSSELVVKIYLKTVIFSTFSYSRFVIGSSPLRKLWQSK